MISAFTAVSVKVGQQSVNIKHDTVGFYEALKIREEFIFVGLVGHSLNVLLHISLNGLTSSAGSAPNNLIRILGDISNLNGSHLHTIAL